jgi:hypothetical protein
MHSKSISNRLATFSHWAIMTITDRCGVEIWTYLNCTWYAQSFGEKTIGIYHKYQFILTRPKWYIFAWLYNYVITPTPPSVSEVLRPALRPWWQPGKKSFPTIPSLIMYQQGILHLLWVDEGVRGYYSAIYRWLYRVFHKTWNSFARSYLRKPWDDRNGIGAKRFVSFLSFVWKCEHVYFIFFPSFMNEIQKKNCTFLRPCNRLIIPWAVLPGHISITTGSSDMALVAKEASYSKVLSGNLVNARRRKEDLDRGKLASTFCFHSIHWLLLYLTVPINTLLMLTKFNFL